MSPDLFSLPPATSLYVALYVVTWFVHMLLMSYVLAGAGLLAARSVRAMVTAPGAATPRLLEVVLADWLPFFLGAAITAGVAPLLFVQVLYKENFYTANLLLVHRWMAILPALIVAFYLLYVMKTAWFSSRPAWQRCGVTVAAWGLFLFVAQTWTENHLLSLRGPDVWVPFYASGAVFYQDPALIARLGVWLGLTFPAMATIAATQIAWLAGRPEVPPSHPEARAQGLVTPEELRATWRRLANLSGVGILLAGACAFGYPLTPTESARIGGLPACVSGGAVMIGMALQAVGWWRLRRQPAVSRGLLGIVWGGLASVLGGVAVLREQVRLAHLDVTALYPQHARAAHVDGLGAFVIFGLINAMLIAACVRLGASVRAHRGAAGVGPERLNKRVE
jgi:hypothetical protein